MFISNPCSHSFCNDCIGKYVEAKIQENIAMVKCPDVCELQCCFRTTILPFDCSCTSVRPMEERPLRIAGSRVAEVLLPFLGLLCHAVLRAMQGRMACRNLVQRVPKSGHGERPREDIMVM
ncbi:hypothetical protein GOBAR_DD20056 [Gossypium barbadense]|nr:hypothetical protein GOBAR_DD20056 [Gossypium barbadense]